MARIVLAAFQNDYAARLPEWRWDWGCWIAKDRRFQDLIVDDDVVECIVWNLRRRPDDLSDEKINIPVGDRATFRADLIKAHRIFKASGPKRIELEARLLARQNSIEIAQRQRIPIRVVDLYEQVFFNIRDRMDGHDWIVRWAIGYRPGPRELPLSVAAKWFGYFAGSLVLEEVLPFCLDGGLRLNMPLDVGTPQGRHAARVVQAISILTLPHSQADAMQFMRMHLGLMHRDRARAAATFEQASLGDAFDRHFLAMGRSGATGLDVGQHVRASADLEQEPFSSDAVAVPAA